MELSSDLWPAPLRATSMRKGLRMFWRLKQVLESPWFDWIIRIAVLASLILGIQVAFSQRALDSCVANWADQYSAAASQRSTAQQQRVNALHKLVVDTINKAPQSVLKADADAFEAEEAEYAKAVNENPPPPTPQYAC